MVKIYTKKGDFGYTYLATPLLNPIPKYHPKINLLGNMDELNAHLGLLRSLIYTTRIKKQKSLTIKILNIQKEIFQINAYIAGATKKKLDNFTPISNKNIQRLEREIDHFWKQLPKLTSFVIPGDNLLNATTHIARTVCRRAERSLVELAQQQNIEKTILAYMNRLSDWLFVLSRIINEYLK